MNEQVKIRAINTKIIYRVVSDSGDEGNTFSSLDAAKECLQYEEYEAVIIKEQIIWANESAIERNESAAKLHLAEKWIVNDE